MKVKSESWLPHFLSKSYAFEIFNWLPENFCTQTSWPATADYNLLPAPFFELKNAQSLAIHFQDQTGLEEGYESMIYQTGKVPTRPYNWHDFFNMLIWKTFPLIKAALNEGHYHASQARYPNTARSSLESLLTLFDESGLIVISSDESLLQLIRSMSWKELFWERRQQLQQKLRLMVFGHSLHEKLLNPYIGMVGHAILFKVDQAAFPATFDHINILVAHWVLQLSLLATPRTLYPIPFLGYPGMHPNANHESFYNDKNYFRETRRS